MNHIRVLVADDHAIVREGIIALINSEPGMQVVGNAGNGEEAIAKAADLNPDVILLDIQMPKKTGVQAAEAIKDHNPQARILMLTSFGDDQTIFSAIKAGAMGYLLKDSAPADLLLAIRQLAEGRSVLHPDIALRLMQEISKPTPHLPLTVDPLTEREVELLRLVAKGKTNLEMADMLVISERTVRTHISNILGKLHLANRTQAALYALKEGIAKLED
jgi:NarL family two-component system response regulator LiaR